MRFSVKRLGTLTFAACLLALSNTTKGQTGRTPGDASKGAVKQTVAARPVRGTGAGDDVQREILSELRQIRALLEKEQQPAAQAVVAAAPGAPAAAEKAKVSTTGFEIGNKNAPITIVEFADYQCPFCRQFHTTVFEQLKKDYIDTGKVRFVSRDLPLDFHPNAASAALAARCAGEQDRYWEMRNALITHSDNLGAATLAGYAQSVGLDLVRFNACLEKRTYSESINQDLADATSAGILGTPSFVIGPTEGRSVYGEKLIGAQSYETFERILASLEKK